MRRRLIVLRHAKSDWSGGVADHDRPLAGRGRREAALAGRWLGQNAADIDLVVCSSAKRARQTWKLVAKQLDNVPPSRVDDRLYAASVRGLLAVVRKLPDSARAVLLIGHNPGLEELILESTARVQLSPSHPGLHLIQAIRDEAHRFAITYHRQLRAKQGKRMALDEIEGE
jgi:phosphohistidine phosphatase